MVCVSVSDIDCREVLAAVSYPARQSYCLLPGGRYIDQDGITLAIDEGRRGWVPEGFLRVGRRCTRYNGYTRSNKDVPLERSIFSVCYICWHTLSNLGSKYQINQFTNNSAQYAMKTLGYDDQKAFDKHQQNSLDDGNSL